MATIAMQRDLVIALKRETLLNLGILSKIHSMPLDLTRQVFKENALEKPTQSMFNHLAYYLVSIIDSQASSALPWPLYDTKAERNYRNELSTFISCYSNKGLLSPLMSSYLVNPGCYKVTFLIFQLSQLAVQGVLVSKMDREHQKKLYHDMTEQFKSQNAEGIIEGIEKETKTMLSKSSNYVRKRQAMEKIAEILHKKIVQMDEKLVKSKAQTYINNLVDGFLKATKLDAKSEEEILKIKNVNESVKFFDTWLDEMDAQIIVIETEWDQKITPFIRICQETYENTEALIARQTGEAEKSSFMIEYNPKTDEISTKDLQNEVNSEQKYILKNIVRDDRLNFPNLIRGFLVSICYILKNTEIGNEIYRFNEYLDGGRRNYSEMLGAMRILLDRVMNAESRLQPASITFDQSLSVRETSEIPPLPDLSDLKMNREFHPQILFDPFTPLNLTKRQFNLHRKMTRSFTKPAPKSLLVTPFQHTLRDDFLHSVISCRISSYDRPNTTQNFHNLSVISQVTSRGNETIAECSSGFTKQQINRLLSTKKTSSSKKYKFKTERPDINIKKGGLFNESNFSNDSIVMTRSHSSPNLFENRDKKLSKARSRKLSIMKEDSPSLLEVSGIAALDRESNHSTPQGVISLESSKKLTDSSSMPVISTVIDDKSISSKEVYLNKEIENISTESQTVLQRNSTDAYEKETTRTETPKTNAQLVRKTSSLEKIINRFKKVRASVLPSDKADDTDIKTILEEKENMNMVNIDVFTANRILLPDLLSPSCSILEQRSNDYLEQLLDSDDEGRPRKPRESLGTALGVDHTFLDQFDLID